MKYQKGLRNKNKTATLVLAETLLIDIFLSTFIPFCFCFYLPPCRTIVVSQGRKIAVDTVLNRHDVIA